MCIFHKSRGINKDICKLLLLHASPPYTKNRTAEVHGNLAKNKLALNKIT